MKHTKDNNFYLTRFQECVKFLTQRNIIEFIHKDNLKSINYYKKQSAARKAYYLNIDYSILSKLTQCNKTFCLNDFLEKSKNIFTYHRHCHKKYKSGKQFSRNSWFELKNESDIKICFDNPSFIHTNNKEILSKESHNFIDKIYSDYFLKKNLEEYKNEISNELLNKLTQIENEITKKEEEKEQYKSDKTIVKQINKDIKKEKNKLIKIKKEIKKEIIEIMQTKNEQIKALQEQIKTQQEQIKVLKSNNKELESQAANLKDSDIPIEEPVEEEEHLIEYDEVDKYFPDGIEQSDLVRLSDDCKQKLEEDHKKAIIEDKKNDIKNWPEEKIHTEITNAEKLLANFENEMKDFEEDIEEIVEEKPIQKQVDEKPVDKNSDIPFFVEDRFQEFIDKKYMGPYEATILWCGLNEITANNPPKFKANGYIPCERNTTKNEKGNTPQQIIVARIIDQMQQQNIEIINEKLKERFYNTLNHMVA